jgi:hypothetical protein
MYQLITQNSRTASVVLAYSPSARGDSSLYPLRTLDSMANQDHKIGATLPRPSRTFLEVVPMRSIPTAYIAEAQMHGARLPVCLVTKSSFDLSCVFFRPVGKQISDI